MLLYFCVAVLFAHLIVSGCSLQSLVVVQVLLWGDLTGQCRCVEQHACLLIAQTGQSYNTQKQTHKSKFCCPLDVNLKSSVSLQQQLHLHRTKWHLAFIIWIQSDTDCLLYFVWLAFCQQHFLPLHSTFFSPIVHWKESQSWAPTIQYIGQRFSVNGINVKTELNNSSLWLFFS